MKNYKENFLNAVNYAVEKTKNKHWKLILLGIMGVVYVALSYIAFILILGSWTGVVTIVRDPITHEIVNTIVKISGGSLITAAAIFPVGLIMIVFLGGSLFTSDNLTMIAYMTKKVKFKPIIIKWMYTLIGNIVGSILMGALVRAANVFASDNYLAILGYLCGKKIDLAWYYSIFSGILCNIIVAGSVWASLASSHSSAKIFLLYLPIWLFAIVGFQHIVANCLLFSMASFYMINPEEANTVLIAINAGAHNINSNINNLESLNKIRNSSDWINPGKFIFGSIFVNMIPAGFGNWLSGAIILPYTYYWLSSWRKEHLYDNNLNNCNKEIKEIKEIVLEEKEQINELINEEKNKTNINKTT